jgi:hypothetical protein
MNTAHVFFAPSVGNVYTHTATTMAWSLPNLSSVARCCLDGAVGISTIIGKLTSMFTVNMFLWMGWVQVQGVRGRVRGRGLDG